MRVHHGVMRVMVSILAAVLGVALYLGASAASAAIVVSKPPAALCLAHRGATLRLSMSLNEGWADSDAVKGRITVASVVEGHARPLAIAGGNFGSGFISLTMHPRTAARLRITYGWLIPSSYLAKQRVRPGARAFYRTGQWQVASTFLTRVRSCP